MPGVSPAVETGERRRSSRRPEGRRRRLRNFRARWFDSRRSSACRSGRGAATAGAHLGTTQDASIPGQRDNGQRFGVRFRRGSRAPSRGGRNPPHRRCPDRGPEWSNHKSASLPVRQQLPMLKPRLQRRRRPSGQAAAAQASRCAGQGACSGFHHRGPCRGLAAGSSPKRARTRRRKNRNEPGPTGSHAARLFFVRPTEQVASRVAGMMVVSTRRWRADGGPDRRDRGLPRLR